MTDFQPNEFAPPLSRPRSGFPSPESLAADLCAGSRTALARAITLIESRAEAHRPLAHELLTRLAPHAAARGPLTLRLGITGVPGVGKSTFIDALGTRLCNAGKRLAVLAVDPSSTRTGGSILGDKTRMADLAAHPNAFIRPSPSAGTLGGVARRTRETALLCEAAGFDILFIETVGVGQSETMVADMTDCFLALMLPGAGDGLQGIKRGLLELAEVIAVNKADAGGEHRAEEAAREYREAARIMHPRDEASRPDVLTCSARTGLGVDEVWRAVDARVDQARRSGAFEARRRGQAVNWMRALLIEGLESMLAADPSAQAALAKAQRDLIEGTVPPSIAAERVLDAFRAGFGRG